jgi:hypothetical protein
VRHPNRGATAAEVSHWAIVCRCVFHGVSECEETDYPLRLARHEPTENRDPGENSQISEVPKDIMHMPAIG